MTCLRNAAKRMWLGWLKSELPTQKRCRQKEQDVKARLSYVRLKACLGYRRPFKNKPLRKFHRSENIGVCYDLCIKDGEYEYLYWLEITCKNSQVDNYKKRCCFHSNIKE